MEECNPIWIEVYKYCSTVNCDLPWIEYFFRESFIDFMNQFLHEIFLQFSYFSNNVWCIKNRTKHSSKTLLSLVQFLMHQTLVAAVLNNKNQS